MKRGYIFIRKSRLKKYVDAVDAHLGHLGEIPPAALPAQKLKTIITGIHYLHRSTLAFKTDLTYKRQKKCPK